MNPNRLFSFGLLSLLSAACFFACSSQDSQNSNDPSAGGASGNSGGKQSGAETAIGALCKTVADCENGDSAHCNVSCENVNSKLHCVTHPVDGDQDGEGTSLCKVAPGTDCDDEDAAANQKGAALALSSLGCAVESSGKCASARQAVTWLDDESPLLVYRDPDFDRFVGLPLGLDGKRPASSWSWTAPALKTGEDFAAYDFDVSRGSSPDAIGFFWFAQYPVTGGTEAEPRFALGSSGAQKESLTQVVMGVARTAKAPINFVQAAIEHDGTRFRVRYDADSALVNDTHLVADAQTAETYGYHTSITRKFDLALELVDGSERALNVQSGRQLFAGAAHSLNELATSATPVSLVAYVRELDGNTRVDGGTDTDFGLELLDASPATPRVLATAASPWGEDFALFYRDTANQTPLTLQRIGKNQSLSGSPLVFQDSDLLPRAAADWGELGLVLVGLRSGSKPGLYAQRFSSTGELLGEPILLSASASSDAVALEGLTLKLQGERGAILFQQSGARYRLMQANRCRK